MTEIFKTVVARLKLIDGVKWIDKDKKQIDNYETKPSVPFPCLLISIYIPLAETITPGQQICTGTIIIRTAHDLATSETSSAAPTEAIDRSLDYYTIVDEVFNKLQSYTDDHIDSIDRVSCVEEADRKDGLTVVKTTFKATFVEYQAAD